MINRAPSLLATTDGASNTAEIAGFSISDDGVGFTESNFESFNTLDSAPKESIGGKGVGRLLWLFAFQQVSVESRFTEEGVWWNRRFDFRRSRRGVESASKTRLDVSWPHSQTAINLIGFREQYRTAAPKTAKAIAKRIIEHCLVSYMLESVPTVIVSDPAAGIDVDLDDLYSDEFRKASSSRQFVVKGHEFTILDMFLRASSEAENALHYCANRRVVLSSRFGEAIPHSDRPITVLGETVRYSACITGPLLDQRVDALRTAFDFDREGDLPLLGAEVSWEEIARAAVSAVEVFLQPHTLEAKRESLARIRKVVDETEPRYKVLLGVEGAQLEDIPLTISDERLEVELHKRLATLRHRFKVEVAERMQTAPEDHEGFAQFREDVFRTLGNLHEIAKSDLEEYVVHRRTVLDFFQKLLGLMESGKCAREDALHGLFFPLRKTSDDIDYEDHNLWLIDERLAFHHYLASDIRLDKQARSPVTSDSQRRPDVLICNRQFAFAAEDLRPFSSVVLVEFKRPQRDDYSSDENPAEQIYEYIRELRDGRAVTTGGAAMDRIEDSVPFFCFAIVTLDASLRKQLENLDFTLGADGQSYFSFNRAMRAYVEVSSYSRVLQDAVKRNKAFFEKLGLHTGIRHG